MQDLTNLPEGWQVVRLGDVADIARGVSWSREQESSTPINGAFPVVRIGNVQRDGFHMNDSLYIRGISDDENIRHAITNRTLVMVGSNGNPNRVGNTFLATPQVTDHLLASFLIRIQPFETLSERFLAASLRSDRLQSLITRSTSGSTGIRNLSINWLRDLNLMLPPLLQQRAIAAVLDAIDKTIKHTEAAKSATECLRDALLHEFLTRGVPGWHTKWRDVPGLGTVPTDWEVVSLKELLVVDQPGTWGQNPTPNDRGVRVLRAADLTRDGRVIPDGAAWRRISKRDRERRLLKDGDLMLERSGGGPGSPVGRVALINGFGSVYCNNFCQQLRVDAIRCDPRYAVRALWHRYLRGVTARLEHQTTGIRNLDYSGYLTSHFRSRR